MTETKKVQMFVQEVIEQSKSVYGDLRLYKLAVALLYCVKNRAVLTSKEAASIMDLPGDTPQKMKQRYNKLERELDYISRLSHFHLNVCLSSVVAKENGDPLWITRRALLISDQYKEAMNNLRYKSYSIRKAIPDLNGVAIPRAIKESVNNRK